MLVALMSKDSFFVFIASLGRHSHPTNPYAQHTAPARDCRRICRRCGGKGKWSTRERRARTGKMPCWERVARSMCAIYLISCNPQACRLAKHRNSKTVGIKDVQLHLEKAWNMKLPGSFSGTSVKRRHHLITSAGKSRLTMRKKTTARKKVRKTSSGGGGRKVSPKRSGKSSSNR